MTRRPRKITLGQARRQGDIILRLYCVTRRTTPAPYGGGPNVCGHYADFDMDEAIARWGPDLSMSDIPARCSVCGGREIDARAFWPTTEGGQPLSDTRLR